MYTPVQPKKIYAAIINIRIAFADNTPESGDIKIEKLSALLSTVAPAITRNGGILTRVTEEGITAVFESGAENALQGALDVFGDASRAMGTEQLSALSIGIHMGPVFLAELGYGNFSALVAVSEGVHVAWRLCESAARYDARILMTQTALDGIRSYDTRFSCRKLGLIYRQSYDTEEMIYDMFDSDPTNLKYRKRRSKLVFETGVNLYLNGEYLQSRNSFIELLKYDRNDKTAKEYIYMCDKALSGSADSATDQYLEIW